MGVSVRVLKALVPVVALAAAGPVFAPELLAFPHHAEVAGKQVYSVEPINESQLTKIIARADALVATSPLSRGTEKRRIFLTNGGWRWHWLTIGAGNAFGISRALGEPIVLNRSSLGDDTVTNGSAVAGERSLSGTIAHEVTHGMIRREIGHIPALNMPTWLIEGYADHVADESSLSEAEYAELKARGERHPAMPYYEGRRKVAALLADNGGSVQKLFAESY
ncbi:hypothetical protein [Altererythrobacter sp. ZODW24]|uniref:hypothetical protein n=1 Tax=Altererythrobacter sp. ZODW24 TaxID=2185142 RepID=UPI0013B3A7A4|nr:hypothetical protein [Altererythrobacter sp. ZODW24]